MKLRPLIDGLIRLQRDGQKFQITEALFLRLLGLIYVSSFASFAWQIVGLSGSRGVAPASEFLKAIREQSGGTSFTQVPTIFWLGINDTVLLWSCIAGSICGLSMAAGRFARLSSAICWILYLSIVAVGQPFSNFQWDALLLETGFLALFAGAPLLAWAYRFLLFRLMFESGLVKLFSHDPNWRNLHALRFHFMTQPLPNPVAWYADHLPFWALDSMTAATLIIELAAPLLLFAPRRFRHTGTGLLILLQLVILSTGNYAFFNLLTIALCLWGLDDDAFGRLDFLANRSRFTDKRWFRAAASAGLIMLMVIGVLSFLRALQPRLVRSTSRLFAALEPFEVVNTYGLFAVMTTNRAEIVIEGSDDQVHWKEYAFRYKPGDPRRELPLVAPYQPRLDWQMWFAALGTYQESPWVAG